MPTGTGTLAHQGRDMTRTSFIAIPALVALAGCMTSGYSYRGGHGDYYYGQPTIEYRHYGYGTYDSFDYPYGYGGYGDPYWYYNDPYSHYYYYYVPVPQPQPQPPPTQAPPSHPGDPDASVEHWAREHGYPLRTLPPGSGDEGGSATSVASIDQLRDATQPQPRLRTTAPDSARSTKLTISPPRPQTASRQAAPPRPTYPARPATTRSSSSSDHEDGASLRRRP